MQYRTAAAVSTRFMHTGRYAHLIALITYHRNLSTCILTGTACCNSLKRVADNYRQLLEIASIEPPCLLLSWGIRLLYTCLSVILSHMP